MTDGDISIEEKRVYADRTGKTEVFVASGIGVVVVEVSDDLVGEFGVEHRCTAVDIAGGSGRVAVATDEDVLLAGEEFRGLGFGPAVAVGFDGTSLLGGDADGAVSRFDGEWTRVGEAGAVRAIDGTLVAAADGVYRVDDGVSHVGLDDARDVTTTGVPLAATGDGLYKLGNGWMDVADGSFEVVSAAEDGRAHAVGPDGLLAREGDDEWVPAPLPVDEAVVDVAYAPEATCAVTDGGTFLVDAGDGWRTQPLGLRQVAGLTVP